MCKTAYFIQQVHLPERTNGHCKNQVSGCGIKIFLVVSEHEWWNYDFD